MHATDTSVPAWALERAVREEDGDAAFAEVVRAMAQRFLDSELGARLRRVRLDFEFDSVGGWVDLSAGSIRVDELAWLLCGARGAGS